jgi:hypothetical protein
MSHQTRREFIHRGLLGLAALPLGLSVLSRSALAEDLPRLDPNDPEAQAMNYVEDARAAEGHGAYEAGRTCSNCRFFQAGTEECELFPGNRVRPGGWCVAWAE